MGVKQYNATLNRKSMWVDCYKSSEVEYPPINIVTFKVKFLQGKRNARDSIHGGIHGPKVNNILNFVLRNQKLEIVKYGKAFVLLIELGFCWWRCFPRYFLIFEFFLIGNKKLSIEFPTYYIRHKSTQNINNTLFYKKK